MPDELLGEEHAVLQVHVPVGHAVNQEEGPLDVAGPLAAVAADQAARLVPRKVVLGETQETFGIGAR